MSHHIQRKNKKTGMYVKIKKTGKKTKIVGQKKAPYKNLK